MMLYRALNRFAKKREEQERQQTEDEEAMQELERKADQERMENVMRTQVDIVYIRLQ